MAFMFLREALLTYQEPHSVAGSGLEVSQCDPGLHGMQWHRELHALSQSEGDVTAEFSTPTGYFATAIEVDFTAKSDRIPGIGSGAGIGATSEIGDEASTKFKAVVRA